MPPAAGLGRWCHTAAGARGGYFWRRAPGGRPVPASHAETAADAPKATSPASWSGAAAAAPQPVMTWQVHPGRLERAARRKNAAPEGPHPRENAAPNSPRQPHPARRRPDRARIGPSRRHPEVRALQREAPTRGDDVAQGAMLRQKIDAFQRARKLGEMSLRQSLAEVLGQVAELEQTGYALGPEGLLAVLHFLAEYGLVEAVEEFRTRFASRIDAAHNAPKLWEATLRAYVRNAEVPHEAVVEKLLALPRVLQTPGMFSMVVARLAKGRAAGHAHLPAVLKAAQRLGDRAGPSTIDAAARGSWGGVWDVGGRTQVHRFVNAALLYSATTLEDGWPYFAALNDPTLKTRTVFFSACCATSVAEGEAAYRRLFEAAGVAPDGGVFAVLMKMYRDARDYEKMIDVYRRARAARQCGPAVLLMLVKLCAVRAAARGDAYHALALEAAAAAPRHANLNAQVVVVLARVGDVHSARQLYDKVRAQVKPLRSQMDEDLNAAGIRLPPAHRPPST
eukprot:TRINITY_DN14382_c0_g1_i1.p1 TRINITY_DN14382_c0_g1~~TRINITY_DN14382_c0_g1_i1.p1  ORF type:complete len:508 (+),score=137.05 TRINITY_DN14382_c0_g1_i1:211-1734(+)